VWLGLWEICVGRDLFGRLGRVGRLGLDRRLDLDFDFCLDCRCFLGFLVRGQLGLDQGFSLGMGLLGGCRLRGLGRLGGLELLLGRQLAALGDDQQPQLGGDVAEDLDRDRVAADALDRADAELAPVDPDLQLVPELVGDVRRGDRAEQRAGRAGVDVEAKLGLVQPRRDRLGLVRRLRLVPCALLVPLLELADEPGRRQLGAAAWQEVVARETARNVDDLAASPRSRRPPPSRSSRPSAT
jgi:hypothetical protein